MWPACLNKLTPIGNNLIEQIPNWIEEFGEQEALAIRQMLTPLYPIKFLGTCKTSAYPEYPTDIPTHNRKKRNNVAEYYARNNLGKYYWFDFNLVGIDNQKIELRMVVNEGDADSNDGFWGVVWERNTEKIIANIISTGDCESTIEATDLGCIERYKPHNIQLIDFLDSFSSIKFKNNLELEKLIGLATITYILVDWFHEEFAIKISKYVNNE